MNSSIQGKRSSKTYLRQVNNPFIYRFYAFHTGGGVSAFQKISRQNIDL